jgi:hypothetical protein
MQKKWFLVFLGLLCNQLYSQNLTVKDSTVVDSLYREDQFYFGLTYNTLQNKPSGFSQSGFSTGLSIGFLRDMPINKARTKAVATGVGFSYNTYNHNLLVSETEDGIQYQILEDVSYDKNRLTIMNVEVPLELRWRTSTPQSHRFFRLYTGIKLSYSIYNRSLFKGEETIKILNNSDLSKFKYGVYVATGYNTWNFYAYYGLTPLFNSEATINGDAIDFNSLQFGLMFYIL